jgi:hypothetical protein
MTLGWVFLFAVSLGVAAVEPAPDPLATLNAAFRSAYATERSAGVESQGPVVVVSGDELLLYRNNAVTARAVIRPEAFHRSKSVSHVPLALRLLVKGAGGGPLGAERVARLLEIRGAVAAALHGAPEAFPEGREDAVKVLSGSLAFLDGALAAGRVSEAQLQGFGLALKEPLEALAKRAAVLQLEAMARVVPAWRSGLASGEWEALRVVVIGSHMAREGEIAWQYFARLLGDGREGGRLVFAEEKWNPRDALALLATHRVDADLGEAFFGDPGRLHRDLLADAAGVWLEAHPPRP